MGKIKPARGRPVLPKSQRLNPFVIRASDEDRETWIEIAAGKGLSLSAWIRQTLNRAAKRSK